MFSFAFVLFISVERSKTDYNTLTKMATLENSPSCLFLCVPTVRQKPVMFLEAGRASNLPVLYTVSLETLTLYTAVFNENRTSILKQILLQGANRKRICCLMEVKAELSSRIIVPPVALGDRGHVYKNRCVKQRQTGFFSN